MALSPSSAMQVFIGLALLLLAAPLLVAGRRRPEGVTLATFLLLVAANFLFNAFGNAASAAGRVAFLALALDPFFLAAFVTLYPYRRRPIRVRWFLAAMAACAIIGATWVLGVHPGVAPSWPPWSDVFFLTFPRVFLVATLVLGYAGALYLTASAIRDAPSSTLGRRAIWLATATGVAVVPRLAVVPSRDLGVDFWDVPRLLGAEDPGFTVSNLAIGIQDIIVGLFALALVRRWLRDAAPRALRAEGARQMALLSTIVVALLAGNMLTQVWVTLGGPDFGFSVIFGARWLIFAGILVHGVLAYEVVDFPRASERAVPAYGALLAGVAAFLLVWSMAWASGETEFVSLGLGTAVGLGVAGPAGLATRAFVRQFASPSSGGAERRLELYQAAVEAASGPGPSSVETRKQLDRDRRAFGVTIEEARAIEHVLAKGQGAGSRPLQPGDEPMPGLVIERTLGEGAHGRVFAARRYPAGERVAVKEVRLDGMDGADARRRLLAELRALRDLRHPRIVGLLEAQVRGGRSFLVMPLIDGQPLSDRLARAPMSPAEVRRTLADLLAALEHAHAAGVVHRDVKPSNILLDREGRAYLTDFGIAALRPPGEAQTAASRAALTGPAGTLAYMAPEQVRGGRVGPAADLYAVALVAFEALTGRPALDLAHRSVFEAMERVARPVIDVAQAPVAWQGWLAKATAVEPGERFGSAAEMRQGLPP